MEGMLDAAGVEDYLERVHDVDHAADIHSDLELAAMLPKVVPRRYGHGRLFFVPCNHHTIHL